LIFFEGTIDNFQQQQQQQQTQQQANIMFFANVQAFK
jgi:hypothetical protein